MQITDLTVDAEIPEYLIEKDTEVITLTEPLRFKFKMANNTGMEIVNGSHIQMLSSDHVQELFLHLKKSMNRIDILGLRDVHEALRQKCAKETELDTNRVRANPKKIKVFGHSQYVFL